MFKVGDEVIFTEITPNRDYWYSHAFIIKVINSKKVVVDFKTDKHHRQETSSRNLRKISKLEKAMK